MSPLDVMRRKHHEFELSSRPGPVRKVRFLLHRWARPLDALTAAISFPASAARLIKEREGVTIRRQHWDRFWLHARFGLGPFDYYQYRLFEQVNRSRADRYFPQRSFLRALNALYPDQAFPFLWDKRAFHEHCQAQGLPTAALLAQFRNGQLEMKAEQGWDHGVCTKPALGFHGRGVRVWKGDGRSGFVGEAGRTINREELLELLGRPPHVDEVIETRVRNHSQVGGLTGGGLCTVRIATGRTSRGVEMFMPTYRMPVGASPVDNFRQGNLVAPVDLESGRLGTGVVRDARGIVSEVERHPDGGQRIAGSQLPAWQDAIDLCQRAGATSPYAFVGWDIGLSETGHVLIEGNPVFGCEAPQVAHNHPIGETNLPDCYVRALRERGQ